MLKPLLCRRRVEINECPRVVNQTWSSEMSRSQIDACQRRTVTLASRHKKKLNSVAVVVVVVFVLVRTCSEFSRVGFNVTKRLPLHTQVACLTSSDAMCAPLTRCVRTYVCVIAAKMMCVCVRAAGGYVVCVSSLGASHLAFLSASSAQAIIHTVAETRTHTHIHTDLTQSSRESNSTHSCTHTSTDLCESLSCVVG